MQFVSRSGSGILGRLFSLLSLRTGTGPYPYEADKVTISLIKRYHKTVTGPHIKLTNQKALLVPRTNHNWFADPSIILVRDYTAALLARDEEEFGTRPNRKYGNTPKCTHYVETADLAVNLASNLKLPIEVISFVAYTHDHGEDFRKLGVTAEDIVRECWKGDKKYKTLIISAMKALTDDERLKGHARHLEQIKVARSDPTGLIAHVRFCDKLNSLVRDYSTLISGEMPFGDEKKFRDYFVQRQDVVKELNISPRLKRWYARLLSKVEKALEERTITGKTNASRNDLLDPINFVPSSPSDGPRLTRKMLGALAP